MSRGFAGSGGVPADAEAGHEPGSSRSRDLDSAPMAGDAQARWRRAGLAFTLALMGVLLLAQPARATLWLQGTGDQVLVQELPPVAADTLRITTQGSGSSAVYVFENDGGIQASAPCVLLTPTRGQCPAEGRGEIIVRLGGGNNVLRPELGTATGPGFGLVRFDSDAGNGRDRFDLDGNALPTTVLRSVVSGGGGVDRLLAGAASLDIQTGGLGADKLVGSDGRDLQRGSDGRDLLFGLGGRDVIRAGAGADHLSGGAGRDQLFGEIGNDTLNGGAGFDAFNGGPGNDRARDAALTSREEHRAKSVEDFG
jgi:hypothetical protein